MPAHDVLSVARCAKSVDLLRATDPCMSPEKSTARETIIQLRLIKIYESVDRHCLKQPRSARIATEGRDLLIEPLKTQNMLYTKYITTE